jgi:hypothetical protein
MLIRLTYASRADGVLTPLDVKDILRSSQKNNAGFSITGALMLSNGLFLQCLEGDHLAVNALYHHISQDTRHREPTILSYGEIEARLFGRWAMGVVTTTDANRPMFLKYASQAEFDPFQIRPAAVERLFAEMVEHARILPG